jgi:hypothetical protein
MVCKTATWLSTACRAAGSQVMKLPHLKRWPVLAAMVYALFGLVLFGFSIILYPALGESEDGFYFALLDNSYPCANYTFGCPIDVGFKTAIFIEDHTRLGAYIEKSVDPVVYLDKHPFLNFWFTKSYSVMAPWYWLFKILFGCLFYYVVTWLSVKLVTLWRRRHRV